MIKNEAFHIYENCLMSYVIISYCIQIANHLESDVKDEDLNNAEDAEMNANF